MQKSHQILKNIRAIREMQKISQDQMAKKLGITQSRYARFEKEGKKIDYKLIEKIADVFKVEIIFIINFHTQSLNLIQYKSDHHSPEIFGQKTKVTDPVALQTELRHLKELNDQLTLQLKDKEQIITLFREMHGSMPALKK